MRQNHHSPLWFSLFFLLWTTTFLSCQSAFLGADEGNETQEGGLWKLDAGAEKGGDPSRTAREKTAMAEKPSHSLEGAPQNSDSTAPKGESEPCLNGSTLPCYTGPSKTRNIGQCQDGFTTCRQGIWGPCKQQTLPQSDLCNGKDDDCDGAIDEPDAKPTDCKVAGEEGPCQKGMLQCTNGQPTCVSLKKPVEEICDGKDNDCDGRVDEISDCRQGVPKEGEPCSANRPCDKGLVCLKYGDNRGTYCHVPCKPGQVDQCRHKPKLRCYALQGGSAVCIDYPCQSDRDCSFGFLCRTSSSGKDNLCVPKRPAGPKIQGEFCKTPVEKSGCRRGLRCVLTQSGATSGLCATDCSDGTPCPPYQGKGVSIPSTCMNIPNNMKFCLFLCNSSAQKCPPGMKCMQGFGGQNYCLAP